MRKVAVGVTTALLYFPVAALAFDTTDDIMWPAQGKFPAYPAERDERPVWFSASGGVYHDSNLFRLSDSVNPQTVIGSDHKSDTVYRLGLGLKGDVPVSRQRIVLDAALDSYHYDRFKFVNNNAYRAGLGWLWQAGSQASGDVGYQRTYSLAPLAYIQAPIKDMVTGDRIYGSGGYLLTPRWKIRGAADWVEYEHGAPSQNALDSTTTAGIAGLDYLTPAGDSVGAQLKYSHGDYPNPQLVGSTFVSNNYNEIEASTVMYWVVTGISTLNARLGYTSRSYSDVSQRNYHGFTGRASWDWTPLAKTPINLAVWQEIQSVTDVTASYVLSRGASIGPSWAPTAKVVLQAKLFYVTQNYKGDPGFVLQSTTGPRREDKTRGGVISVGYAPLRNLEFTVSAEASKRTSNTFGRDYNDNIVSANAKVSF